MIEHLIVTKQDRKMDTEHSVSQAESKNTISQTNVTIVKNITVSGSAFPLLVC